MEINANPPAVSVIIPTYNSALYIGSAIESVLSQTYKNFEVLVVDDGSTDETEKTIEQYSQHIRYYKKKNGGPASARNFGIQHARGEFIAFLDADDLYLPEKLNIQVNFLQTHPDVEVVYSDGLRVKNSPGGKAASMKLSQSGELLKSFAHPKDISWMLMIQNVFPINNALSRSNCIHSVGGFDETLTACEDWDLWFRIAERFPVIYHEGEVAVYRVTPNSNSMDFARNNREINKVMEKISSSASFPQAPEPIRQQFFYRRGITALSIGDEKLAVENLRKALAFPFHRMLTLSALTLTVLFGPKAMIFYRLKRNLLGIRGVRQL